MTLLKSRERLNEFPAIEDPGKRKARTEIGLVLYCQVKCTNMSNIHLKGSNSLMEKLKII